MPNTHGNESHKTKAIRIRQAKENLIESIGEKKIVDLTSEDMEEITKFIAVVKGISIDKIEDISIIEKV